MYKQLAVALTAVSVVFPVVAMRGTQRQIQFNCAASYGEIQIFKKHICELRLDFSEALLNAAAYGQQDTVDFLLECDVSVDYSSQGACHYPEGTTALMAAAKGGHVDIMRYLLEEKGANPFMANDQGVTALGLYCEKCTKLDQGTVDSLRNAAIKRLIKYDQLYVAWLWVQQCAPQDSLPVWPTEFRIADMIDPFGGNPAFDGRSCTQKRKMLLSATRSDDTEELDPYVIKYLQSIAHDPDCSCDDTGKPIA